MNDLEKKEIQRDLNPSILIHYLKTYTTSIPHSVHMSCPLLGAACLSPWTCHPEDVRLSPQIKIFQKSHHFLPQSLHSHLPALLSKIVLESPGWCQVR